MNKFIINIAYFWNIFLFYFMVESEIMLVTISNVLVTVAFTDL